MSQVLPTITIVYDQLRSDIQAAWPDVVKIFEEPPREEVGRDQWPYAFIDISEIDEGWEEGATVRQPSQTVLVKIGLRELMPQENLVRYKAVRFDALTNLLMPDSGEWAQFGYLPYVPKRRFTESDNVLEDSIEISLDFRVMFAVDYH